jgi:ribosomal protein L32
MQVQQQQQQRRRRRWRRCHDHKKTVISLSICAM